jgi:steroid delta-isomerase-like uncharacterized protein
MPGHVDHMRSVLVAFNEGDWDRFRELVPDSAVYFESATGRTAQGDDYLELLKGWRAAFPDIAGEITMLVESGDVAVAEIQWTGTHSGTLVGPDGSTVPPSGGKLDNPAAMVNHYAGDTLTRINHYFDLLTLLRQVGAA